MTMETDRLEVRAGRVGRGVFAVSAFDADETIGEVAGQIIQDADYGSDYCVDVGNGAGLEPGEPFRFLNHSCDPNCALVLWRRRQVNKRRYYRVWLETLRPIAAGEELTIDYRWPAASAIRCLCGSHNCRGWIVNPDELANVQVERPSAAPPRNTKTRKPHASPAAAG